MIRTIHLAHSPDSDDAFMFYALADGQIDHRYATRVADLVRSEADSWSGVHRVHHVVDEFLKRFIKESDRLGAAAKDIVAIFDDGEYGQNQDPRFFKLSIIASTVCLARF